MAIRKTGAVTGRITEIDGAPAEGDLVVTGSHLHPAWDGADEAGLADEDEAADRE
jgi:hypothetical protein